MTNNSSDIELQNLCEEANTKVTFNDSEEKNNLLNSTATIVEFERKPLEKQSIGVTTTEEEEEEEDSGSISSRLPSFEVVNNRPPYKQVKILR